MQEFLFRSLLIKCRSKQGCQFLMDLLVIASKLSFIVAFSPRTKTFKKFCNALNSIERQHLCQVRHAFKNESHVTFVCFGKKICKFLIVSGVFIVPATQAEQIQILVNCFLSFTFLVLPISMNAFFNVFCIL